MRVNKYNFDITEFVGLLCDLTTKYICIILHTANKGFSLRHNTTVPEEDTTVSKLLAFMLSNESDTYPAVPIALTPSGHRDYNVLCLLPYFSLNPTYPLPLHAAS